MELKIQHLSKKYIRGKQALSDVSLTIGSGLFGLLGPNGAGKSTLMRILATLQEADSGSAFLDDIDVLKEKDRVREVLGYLPQEFGLYPKETAYGLLDHLAYLKGHVKPHRRRAMLESLLRRTNLWDARDQRLGTFSGGMKQRFGIAQALIGNPQLLIVDEPTAGLDPEERVRFLNILSEIGEHVIVILSTHIVADVSYLCHSMAILHEGRVVAAGEPAELAGALRGRIWQVSPARSEMQRYHDTCQVVSSRFAAGRPFIRVYAEQPPGSEFELVEPEVDDVYFRAMSEPAIVTTASSGDSPC